ncbi:SHC-transforming protein 1-like isoform X1 [Petromyzon marinus]|uniref:SHC-transforming protein 1-like isoform X1 n=2 Tax=Petromyzon marinus TaxID=7757 RepID=UPI003F716FCF
MRERAACSRALPALAIAMLQRGRYSRFRNDAAAAADAPGAPPPDTEAPGDRRVGPAKASAERGPGVGREARRYMEGSPRSRQEWRMNKLGVGGGRRARVEGGHLGGDDWNRNGSLVHKPSRGWLHADSNVSGAGVTYIVRYMGCIEVLQSMRTLDFKTRTHVTREAIARVCEAVPSVKDSFRRRKQQQQQAKALSSVLGNNNLQFSGMNITLTVSTSSLTLTTPDTKQIIASHHMQSISFASGGDPDTTDYVAYVAKDPVNLRACHIVECGDGLAQDVISTIGQAFELRFKQYLKNPPKLIAPHDRMLSLEGSAWDEEEEEEMDEVEEEVEEKHQYYNHVPGRQPPPGGRTQAAGGGEEAGPRPGSDTRGGDVKRTPHGYTGAVGEHTYVNTHVPCAARGVTQPPHRDAFDMRPFEDALKQQGVSPPLPDGGGGSPTPPGSSSPPPPPATASSSMEEALRRERWYHGKMSRHDAEQLLQEDGDFLVRESMTSRGQYVLTGLQQQHGKHLLLVDPHGVVRTKDRRFDSVSHLIGYHRDNQLPIISAGSELSLKQPVERQT